jgi:enoyl-CoA hydratase/carnithine racemase
MTEHVEVRHEELARHVVLRRPEKANALSPEMFDGLIEVFSATPGPRERLAVLSGEGRIFCAGVDLNYIRGRDVAPSPSPFEAVLEAMEAYPLPIVGVVQGSAIAGGMQLALHCDFVVAATDARFGMSLAQIGIAPVWRVAKKVVDLLGPALAREVFLIGDPIPAWRLAELGLVYRAVPEAELGAATDELVARLLENAPLSLRAIKPLLVRLLEGPDTSHADVDELVDIARNSSDALEGLAARLEKRAANFVGA